MRIMLIIHEDIKAKIHFNNLNHEIHIDNAVPVCRKNQIVLS